MNETTTSIIPTQPDLIGEATTPVGVVRSIGVDYRPDAETDLIGEHTDESREALLDGQGPSRIIELNPGIFVESNRVQFDRLAPLSARELDIVQQLVDGHSTDEGAQALYISRHTFRTHVKNILRKLDLHSSLELASVAVECGMRPSRLSA